MKKLSSYNIKWIAIYIVYAVFMWLVEGEEIVYDRKEDGYSFDFYTIIYSASSSYIYFLSCSFKGNRKLEDNKVL